MVKYHTNTPALQTDTQSSAELIEAKTNGTFGHKIQSNACRHTASRSVKVEMLELDVE